MKKFMEMALLLHQAERMFTSRGKTVGEGREEGVVQCFMNNRTAS